MNRPAPADAAFDVLTDAERQCLQFVLDHRTAKEIAVELGITHHAVEKRLRRARDKLGAQSSVEAARWYAQHYGRSAYDPSDLASDKGAVPVSRSSSPSMTRKWKLAIMSGVTLAVAVALLSSQGAQDVASPDAAPAAEPSAEAVSIGLERTLTQEVAIAHSLFDRLDADASGFIDKAEFISPGLGSVKGGEVKKFVLISNKDGTPTARKLEEVDQDGAITLNPDKAFTERRTAMFALIDLNKDGQIDKEEFTAGQLEGIGPRTFTIQIPVDKE